jgi:hypothetical protein
LSTIQASEDLALGARLAKKIRSRNAPAEDAANLTPLVANFWMSRLELPRKRLVLGVPSEHFRHGV